MLTNTDTHREFEALARAFLRQHPEIRHEWREVPNIAGGRTDLICGSPGSDEVFASLTNYQITVGTGPNRTDFEDFGRGLSDSEIAEQAFAQFVSVLRGAGLVDARQHGA